MANPRGPDDRIANDPYTAGMSGMPPRSPQQLDADLQPDPELAEGRSPTSRVAVFALGIAILLAAVFYGLNNSSTNQASNAPPTQSAQTQPAASSGNKAPGVTTGAATNRPATPSQQGGSDVNQSAPPPAGQNNNTH